jgi:hypothetical protein
LGHIPKGVKGSTQNKLRFYYVAYRRRGLAKGFSRGQCLMEAIDKLRTEYPGFNPDFDKNFFQTRKKSFWGRLFGR